MKPEGAFKFCPRCGKNLKFGSDEFLLCDNCDFHFYINPAPCNAVLFENDKQEIMLVRRKVDPKKGYWDLPGGFMKPYESLEESVKREVNEELGVACEVGKIVNIYNDTYVYQGIEYPTICTVVKAKITSGELRAADDVEEFKFFAKEKALEQEIAFEGIKKGIVDYLKSK